jgi:hypothetical protein
MTPNPIAVMGAAGDVAIGADDDWTEQDRAAGAQVDIGVGI